MHVVLGSCTRRGAASLHRAPCSWQTTAEQNRARAEQHSTWEGGPFRCSFLSISNLLLALWYRASSCLLGIIIMEAMADGRRSRGRRSTDCSQRGGQTRSVLYVYRRTADPTLLLLLLLNAPAPAPALTCACTCPHACLLSQSTEAASSPRCCFFLPGLLTDCEHHHYRQPRRRQPAGDPKPPSSALVPGVCEQLTNPE